MIADSRYLPLKDQSVNCIITSQRTEKGYTDCGCNAGFRPGIVLDPFCGSGTTIRVAEKLNRIGIGFDLAYQNLQNKRAKNIQKELFVSLGALRLKFHNI